MMGFLRHHPQPRAVIPMVCIILMVCIVSGGILEITRGCGTFIYLGQISFQFTAQSSGSSINAWTRVPTLGAATPELYSAKASKVQRLLI
jgi:hypothetical protein